MAAAHIHVHTAERMWLRATQAASVLNPKTHVNDTQVLMGEFFRETFSGKKNKHMSRAGKRVKAEQRTRDQLRRKRWSGHRGQIVPLLFSALITGEGRDKVYRC